jgi:hypothetical protein
MGRPKIQYALNCSTEDLRLRLIELIEPCLLEKLTDKELAPRTPSFRDSLDLDLPDFKTWHERTYSAKHDYITHQIQEWVCEIRDEDFAYSYSDLDLESAASLRGRMLTTLLEPYSEDKPYTDKDGKPMIKPKGIQLSGARLGLLLGCSEASINKLCKENNVGVKAMRGWHEVINPNYADIDKELRDAPYSLNKEVGGVWLGISLKVSYGTQKSKYLEPAYHGEAKPLYEKHNGHIDKMYIAVRQPNLLCNINADEIKAKAEAEAKKAAKEAEAKGETDTKVISETAPKVEKKPRKASYVSGKDRVFIGHRIEWETDQVALETHMYTPYKLNGLSVVAENGDVIAKYDDLKKVVLWLNQHASKTAIRTVESYYKPAEVDNSVLKESLITANEPPKVELAVVQKEEPKAALASKADKPRVQTRFTRSEWLEKRLAQIDEAQGKSNKDKDIAA